MCVDQNNKPMIFHLSIYVVNYTKMAKMSQWKDQVLCEYSILKGGRETKSLKWLYCFCIVVWENWTC